MINYSELKFTVVTDYDKDPEKAGRFRNFDPAKHDKETNLPFSQQTLPTSGQGTYEFPRPPRPGTTVISWVPPGAEQTGYSIVLGHPAGKEKAGDKSIPGNMTLPNPQAFLATNVNIPPNLQQAFVANRSGLPKLISQMVEQGIPDSFNLYEGLPTHGAMFPIAGVRNTPLTNIATALDSGIQHVTSALTGSLGASSFSMANLFDVLSPEQLQTLTDSIDPQALASLQNMMLLKQAELEGVSSPLGATNTNMANLDVFLERLIDRLKDAKTYGDLDSIINEMEDSNQYDAETLEQIREELETEFGKVTANVNNDGTVTIQTPPEVQAAIDAATSALNLGSMLGGGLFTSQGTSIIDMVQRFLSPLMCSEFMARLAAHQQGAPDRETARSGPESGSDGATTADVESGGKDEVPFFPATRRLEDASMQAYDKFLQDIVDAELNSPLNSISSIKGA